MGDSNRPLAEEANRFFIEWGKMLRGLFEQAKEQGRLAEQDNSDDLTRLVMSTIEGALLICKASKDIRSFKQTGEALKGILSTQSIS